MERKTYEAAVEGCVTSLKKLLQEDGLALDRFMVGCYVETPLHIASMLGHVEFVEEILSRKPELAGELDSQRSSPLHLATAKGFMVIVKKLASVNPEMCLVRDRDGRNPLHVAVMKGNINVLRELVEMRPQAVRMLMEGSETILHVCVRYNQLEAMKFLVEKIDDDDDDDFVNSKDDDGNTVLHLAVVDKQVEAIKFLTSGTKIQVNALNANDCTALDIAFATQSKRQVKDWQIRELLVNAGALSASNYQSGIFNASSYQNSVQRPSGKESDNFVKKQQDWLERKRSALMVVASLIATMAFQAGLSPPGGVWQETTGDTTRHIAGFSILADRNPRGYKYLTLANTTGFVASLSIILLMISGLPFRHRLYLWVLMVIMWVAVTAIAWTYLISLGNLTEFSFSFPAGIFLLFVWLGLMMILLVGHLIRVMKRAVKWVWKVMKRRSTTSSSMA